jgi:hypothetical protein
LKKIIMSLLVLAVLSVLLLTSGCEDEVRTYVGKPSTCDITERSVNGNLSWAQRMHHEKVLLKQEWLAEYMLSLQVESGDGFVPLYTVDELMPVIPDIQQSLAECGNVRIDYVSNCSMSFSVIDGDMYHGGNIYGESGRIAGGPKTLPANAYVHEPEEDEGCSECE